MNVFLRINIYILLLCQKKATIKVSNLFLFRWNDLITLPPQPPLKWPAATIIAAAAAAAS